MCCCFLFVFSFIHSIETEHIQVFQRLGYTRNESRTIRPYRLCDNVYSSSFHTSSNHWSIRIKVLYCKGTKKFKLVPTLFRKTNNTSWTKFPLRRKYLCILSTHSALNILYWSEWDNEWSGIGLCRSGVCVAQKVHSKEYTLYWCRTHRTHILTICLCLLDLSFAKTLAEMVFHSLLTANFFS